LYEAYIFALLAKTEFFNSIAQNKPLADFGNPIKTGIKISSCSLLFQVFESHAVPPERLHVDCLTLVRG